MISESAFVALMPQFETAESRAAIDFFFSRSRKPASAAQFCKRVITIRAFPSSR
jgi:hypothetical protein